jgi:hypothetical protein
MIKKMFNNSKILLGSILLLTNDLFSQSRPSMAKVEQTVQAGGDSMIRIWVIIGRVAYSAIGAFLVIRLIVIFMQNDKGEDKVMKIGGLAVAIILGAIVVMLAEGVFS